MAMRVSAGILCASLICMVSLTASSPVRPDSENDAAVVDACVKMIVDGLPLIARDRTDRFQGKVDEAHARCRGGERAVGAMGMPWVDWANYWSAGDASSKSGRRDIGSHIVDRNKRGIDGVLLDIEYQRMELIKFNLFDNKTFETYAAGGVNGRAGDSARLRVWKEFRLPPGDPNVGRLAIDADGTQTCKGELIRFRTLTGICNDIRNPAMGSTGQVFSRNVEFEATFPDLERNELAKNRHGGRLSLLRPDPQVISRKLFTRDQSSSPGCNQGRGLEGADADCAYKKAPFFNVLAAYWIQFMTHDWFSHLDEARNDQSRIMQPLGCTNELVNNTDTAISPARAGQLGCRQDDKMEAALITDSSDPRTFKLDGVDRLARSYKTTTQSCDGLVGRVATLRLRRALAPPRQARSRRSGQARDDTRERQHPRRRPLWLSAAIPRPLRAGPGSGAVRSNPTRVGGAGGHRVSGQLVDRAELLAQSVRARTQYHRRRFPRHGAPRTEVRLRAAQSRQPLTARSPTTRSPTTSCSRWLGWSCPPRSPRSTRSNGRRNFCTTSRCISA